MIVRAKNILIGIAIILAITGFSAFYFIFAEKSNINCIEGATVFQFEQANRVELSRDVFNCFKRLLNNGSEESFQILTNSPNPVARAYGFMGILSQLSTEKERVVYVKAKIRETDTLTVRSHDVIYKTNLGSLYLDIALSRLNKKSINELKEEIRKENFGHIDLELFPN